MLKYVDERVKIVRYYISPTEDDLKENKVIELLSERFNEWQQGYSSMMIEEGYNNITIRKRMAYWHQLFNPRQLLVNGLFAKCYGNGDRNSWFLGC